MSADVPLTQLQTLLISREKITLTTAPDSYFHAANCVTLNAHIFILSTVEICMYIASFCLEDTSQLGPFLLAFCLGQLVRVHELTKFLFFYETVPVEVFSYL